MGGLNYYEILEITENASQEVIKAAYRALAKKYHPDSYKGSSAEREKSMAQINVAFDILSNVESRKKYDQQLKVQNKQQDDFENYKNTYQETRMNNKVVDCTEDQETDDFSDIKNMESSEEKFGRRLGRFINAIGKEIGNEMQKNSQRMDNSYLEGLNMNDRVLVQRFKQSKGYERIGYAKALEQRDFLYKNEDGKYEPTFLMKKYL